MTKCRFAPSPTGFLHVGNIRAAIVNFLYAKKTGGQFILRLDDTDIQRVKDEYRDMIFEDMKWLGLGYSELIKQSDRLTRYEEAKNILISSGRLYECYESNEELSLQRKSQTASGVPPIYNRASLELSDVQKKELRDSGLKPHYRFFLEDKEVTWSDKIKGRISYSGRHFSDPVLVRDNGVPTYTFCSVVDDVDFGITDIIRGEDHITNTAIQIQIFEALQAKIPDFAHLALVKAQEGKISKREGGFDIRSLRNDGYEPMAIVDLLARIGTCDPITIFKNFDDLVENFDFSKFSKSATNYDIGELKNINAKLLQITDFDQIKNRLLNYDEAYCAKAWNVLRLNISFFNEIHEWLKIFTSDIVFETEKSDEEFLSLAASLLPIDTKADDAWDKWLSAIKEKSNRKGKSLFMPIRLALTGKEHGPELKFLVNLIDRERIIKRLSASD